MRPSSISTGTSQSILMPSRISVFSGSSAVVAIWALFGNVGNAVDDHGTTGNRELTGHARDHHRRWIGGHCVSQSGIDSMALARVRKEGAQTDQVLQRGTAGPADFVEAAEDVIELAAHVRRRPGTTLVGCRQL